MAKPAGWANASRYRHCPVCGKPDWCSMNESGTHVFCRRVQSDHPGMNGGWHHYFDGQGHRTQPGVSVGGPSLLYNLRAAHYHRRAVVLGYFPILASQLGVSVESLVALRAGWIEAENCWSFPMTTGVERDVLPEDDADWGDTDVGWKEDADEESREMKPVTGICRRWPDGSKRLMKGHHPSLYVPYVQRLASVYFKTLIVCEGASDVASLHTMGFRNICGRFSCSHGVFEVCRLARERRCPRVVVIADTGNQAERDGAAALCWALAKERPTKLVFPPAKDLRSWLQMGATREDVLRAVKASPWLFDLTQAAKFGKVNRGARDAG